MHIPCLLIADYGRRRRHGWETAFGIIGSLCIGHQWYPPTKGQYCRTLIVSLLLNYRSNDMWSETPCRLCRDWTYPLNEVHGGGRGDPFPRMYTSIYPDGWLIASFYTNLQGHNRDLCKHWDQRTREKRHVFDNAKCSQHSLRVIKALLDVCRIWYQDDIDSSLPGQNGRHLVDDTFRCIFVN